MHKAGIAYAAAGHNGEGRYRQGRRAFWIGRRHIVAPRGKLVQAAIASLPVSIKARAGGGRGRFLVPIKAIRQKAHVGISRRNFIRERNVVAINLTVLSCDFSGEEVAAAKAGRAFGKGGAWDGIEPTRTKHREANSAHSQARNGDIPYFRVGNGYMRQPEVLEGYNVVG